MMAKKAITKKIIQKGFQEYLLSEGKPPETVRILTNFLKISDEDFFKHYGSLNTIESSIWKDYYQKSLDVLQKDSDFEHMSGQEKHLSFLYTLLEVIKSDRSYILHRLGSGFPNLSLKYVMSTRRIVADAPIKWVAPPSFVPEKGRELAESGYKTMLWKHSLSMIHFWIKDDSGSAEDTDAFIEKSTRTLFDLGHIPAMESVIDLGKFFLQKMGFAKTTPA